MNHSLWKTLHFDKTRKKVTIQALSYLLKNSNYDTRALIVDDCRRTGFTKDKLKAVMLSARNLERLEIRRPLEAMPSADGGATTPGRKLRHLVLDGFDNDHDGGNVTIRSFLSVCKELEYLELVNSHEPFRHTEATYTGPTFPRLKHLRIASNMNQMLHYVSLTPLIVSPRTERRSWITEANCNIRGN
jgi:hypothetical protein